MILSTPSTPTRISSRKQQLFIRYLAAILLNLTVIGLIDQYWQHVSIDSFTTIILVAIVLHVLLKSTIDIGHRISVFFKRASSSWINVFQILFTWLIFFSSKFIILGIINLIFGDQIIFDGPLDGRVAFISVLSAMILAEQAIVWIYRQLG